MLPIVKFIFWFSVILIFYPYIGYLLILKIISFFKSNNSIADNEEFKPLATLLISAYNEEAVIEDKILNSLDLNYPKELLEIVVISDGSNDKTNELVIKYADKGVVLRHYEGRIGKTACLNRAVPLAKGEIIVFSDANSRYDREAIRELVRSFADKEVGFATGFTRYTTDEGLIDYISLYSRIEKTTKKLESKIASCVGADGAIFAIRKPLYKPLNDYDINDLVIPLNVIKQGYRGIFEERAFCTEKAVSYKGEFNRQVRITNRTLRALFSNLSMFNPFKFKFFSFELLSHKICRFMAPFFMVLILLTNLILSFADGYLYMLILIGQALIYLTALLKHFGIGLSPFYTFTLVNTAIFWGWIRYFRGETYTAWSPTQR
ncbi:MAG: hypothetical protein A2Z50_03605 [Nitrospirae bacterium RBG_19FT_COMBO_42_15]|nr:MAG: hypothetical protein A2Z50_03605 [Nitrospirae bacterium RBG_19FT_COMBO_42_15]